MIADLFATGRTWRGIVEAVRWARVRRLPICPLLRTAYRTAYGYRANALLNLSTVLVTGTARGATEEDTGWCATDRPPSWATLEARMRAAALAEALAIQMNEPPPGTFSTTMAAEGMAEVGRSARADIQLAEALGVSLHNPFTDSRVVDTYLSVSLDERPGPASYKPVLRDAVVDLFPADLAARTTKGDFNPDHYQGMRMNLAELRSLADGRLAALDLVDPRALRRTLTMAAAGLPSPFAHVEPAIAAEVWLRIYEATPKVRWSPAATSTEAV